MTSFNVLRWDFNKDCLIYYDVLPYFRSCFSKEKKKPKTKEELKEFIEKKSMYQFWARCEYEMICHGWPVKKNEYKLDIHTQIIMNIDIITDILAKELL